MDTFNMATFEPRPTDEWEFQNFVDFTDPPTVDPSDLDDSMRISALWEIHMNDE